MRAIPGYSKECRACFVIKLEEEFDYQKTNPTKLYAWCRKCMDERNTGKPTQSAAQDAKEMRAKAKQLKRLTPDQANQLKDDRRIGATIEELCSKYNITDTTVYKYLNDAHKV